MLKLVLTQSFPLKDLFTQFTGVGNVQSHIIACCYVRGPDDSTASGKVVAVKQRELGVC